jgi:hypothetical protein
MVDKSPNINTTRNHLSSQMTEHCTQIRPQHMKMEIKVLASNRHKNMTENTEGAIKNGQSIETGNIGYTRRIKTKQKHNILCVGHHYTQTNKNNINKT